MHLASSNFVISGITVNSRLGLSRVSPVAWAQCPGKTNLLEAVYLLSTLRSFRGVGNSQIIHHGRPAFFAGGTALGQAECDVRYYWSTGQRKLTVNEKPIRRLADYLGTLRTVVFYTEDLHLVKGSAKSRRRFLAAVDTDAARISRVAAPLHRLFSQRAASSRTRRTPRCWRVFTTELIATGSKLMAARRGLVDKLSLGAPGLPKDRCQAGGCEDELCPECAGGFRGGTGQVPREGAAVPQHDHRAALVTR